MKTQKVFTVLFCLLVLAAPFLASAHTSPWDPATLKGPLLTCDQQQQIERNPDGTVKEIVPCSWDELGHTVVHIIVFVLALLFYGIAPILFLWGGIKILTSGSSPEGMSEGKKIITGTLMAILIALLSYWLVDTVLNTLIGKSLEEISVFPAAGAPLLGLTGISDADAKAQFAAAGVEVKPGVSFQGTRQSTLDEVIALKTACGCSVAVTSGTEGTHSEGAYSHANGYKVDLRLDSGLSNYITGSYSLLRYRTEKDGSQVPVYGNSGVTFARETTHWDVTVY